MLADIGQAGQQSLLSARVLVIGAGGLGSASISYLAAAGIGHIGIIDADRVELSNLARQILHETGDIGRLKVESASDRVAEINPGVRVTTYAFALTGQNALSILRDYDVIADGCDNFETRFAVNAACVTRGIPLVSAAIAGFSGQVMSILPGTIESAGCYQCFAHPEAPEANTCRESGVIGPLAGIIGSMQALEVMNVILGRAALASAIAHYDGVRMTQRQATRTRDMHCPVCGA